ncbi:MAG: AraC family transcriptional regulator [Micavibrio aeruginosavorus]|uniref:AraC family transcriptional regulator n=1 Tax=Micavibrio aeruginosavorus TaxID=349221 RepID=A0A2W5MS04_9BACT|nr:MAG: AraC family transcriptional regulator [Micavibrio aeruginosavorus]
MVSAIYGLSDLFRISNQIATGHGVNKQIRVSQWQAKDDGILKSADTHPELPNDPHHIILPPSMVMPAPEQARPVSRWLNDLHTRGTTVCSVCAGSFVLAEAGLLEGRTSTTHWSFAKDMQARYPNVKVDADRMIIDDGDIITAGGIMAWTDLGLKLVHRIMGPTIMLDTARFLLVDPSGREQRFYSNFSPQLHHGDTAILKVQHWLQANGAKHVGVMDMAHEAGMEERTFLRRFLKATGLKPTEYAQQVRVGKAREMLEFTMQNVDQIAWAVGYEDPGAFRKVFHKVMGLTPGDYRARFGMGA